MTEVRRPLILNVDDNEAGRYVTTRALQRAGFGVLEASTGLGALHLVASGPDLVLLDVNLPDISGLEVCRQLKADPGTADIPVIHLSATNVGIGDRTLGLEGGADGYLVQPVEPRELLATIGAFLRLREVQREVGEQWQTTFDAVSDGICLLDGEQRILRCNRAMAEQVGATLGALKGLHCYEIVHGTRAPVAECPVSRARGSRHREQMELQCGDRCFEVTVDPLPGDTAATHGGVVHVMHDITARKQADLALQGSEERFRLAAAATHAVVYDLDLATKRFAALPGLPELLGFDLAEADMTLEWWSQRVHPDDVEQYLLAREPYSPCLQPAHALPSGDVQHYRMRHKSGRELFVDDHATPLCDGSGAVVRMVGTVVDVTATVIARRGLEDLLANRSEFLATCSHELKTPLTVLLANIEIFHRMFGALDEERRSKFLKSMSNQAKKLDRLVTDLLDVSRIESGHLTLNPTPTPLHNLVRRTVNDFGQTCLTHSVGTSHLHDCVVSVDQGRFEQMLINLLTNAAKYSDEGTEITIGVRTRGGQAEVTVTDQGCGIPKDDIAKLFDLYYRHPSTGAKSGLGMGLHVTKELARLHGGAIAVESTLGEGSTFTLTLPLSAS